MERVDPTAPPKPDPPERPKLHQKWEFEDPAVVAGRLFRRQILAWIGAVMILVAAGGLWVQSSADERARNRAYRAAVDGDVVRLVSAQRTYFDDNARFATLERLGADFVSSQGVRVRIHRAGADGWSGSAWHLRISYMCTISIDHALDSERAQPDPACR